jgi:hypothetical protein
MCFKSTQSDQDAVRAKRVKRRATQPGRPGTSIHPRGNGDVDHRDVERSLEKLTALVGR